jgi:hypothetical protein
MFSREPCPEASRRRLQQLLGGESLFQAGEKGLRETGIIATPIIDENLSRHRCSCDGGGSGIKARKV